MDTLLKILFCMALAGSSLGLFITILNDGFDDGKKITARRIYNWAIKITRNWRRDARRHPLDFDPGSGKGA